MRGSRPSMGLDFARRTHILARVFPETAGLPDRGALLDGLVTARDSLRVEGRRWTLMLGGWLAGADRAGIEATLDRLWLHKWKHYDLRSATLATVAQLDHPIASDSDLRRLSVEAEPEVVLTIRAELTADAAVDDALTRARELGVRFEPPAPLLRGRALKPLGFAPGPDMGRVLKHVYALQLDGQITDSDHAAKVALAWKSG